MYEENVHFISTKKINRYCHERLFNANTLGKFYVNEGHLFYIHYHCWNKRCVQEDHVLLHHNQHVLLHHNQHMDDKHLRSDCYTLCLNIILAARVIQRVINKWRLYQ